MPCGVTLTGYWAATAPDGTAANASVYSTISYGLKLPAEPIAHVIAQGAAKPTECQGTIYDPKAAPGHLCIYVHFAGGLNGPPVRIASEANPDDMFAFGNAAGRQGALLNFTTTTGTGAHFSRGTWAVTAP